MASRLHSYIATLPAGDFVRPLGGYVLGASSFRKSSFPRPPLLAAVGENLMAAFFVFCSMAASVSSKTRLRR
jgi:hypothetical protein